MTTGPEGLTREDALFILAALEKSTVQRLEVDVAGLRLVVDRGPDDTEHGRVAPLRAGVTAPRPTTIDAGSTANETNVEDSAEHVSDDAVLSPAAGVFYRSPAPGEPPFVEVGDFVEAGATVGIVESMKLMISVVAPRNGTVTDIRVENNGTVGFDEPLIIIEASHA